MIRIYSGHWAAGSVSIKGALLDTLGASILDFAVSEKNPEEEEEREGERGSPLND